MFEQTGYSQPLHTLKLLSYNTNVTQNVPPLDAVRYCLCTNTKNNVTFD